MLVRVKNPSWNPLQVPDYEETFRLGKSIGCVGSRRTIEALQEDPEVIYVEASRQGSGWEGSSPDSQLSEEVSPPNPLSVTINANKVHQFEKGNKALVGIIDSGIDVLHDAFLDSSGETRILAIWDQTESTDSGSEISRWCPFGKEYTKEEIDEYIRNKLAPLNLRDLSNVDARGQRKNGHGTHVASIAAGREGQRFLGGIAPEAKIVVVKIDPQNTRGLTFTHGCALKYINYVADEVAKLPVVVNVSQGINAGSHDGKSNLEQLYNSDFLEDGEKIGYVVVKSAGNERRTRRHAKFSVTPKVPFELLLNCWGTTREQELIELWFDPGYKLEFCVENPSRERTAWVSLMNKKEEKVFLTKNKCYVIYTQHSNHNGDSVLSIALKKESADSIEEGCWKLIVKKAGGMAEENDIHAWIEIGKTRTVFFESSDECVTLTVPGTADNVIVVGSVRNMSNDFHPDGDSSHGPTRKGGKKPDLVAPGVGIYAACSGTDNEICQMSGTSMAAPHVTGAIALLLSAMENQRPESQLNALQICAAIRRTTQDFQGMWDRGIGCGILDIYKLFEEFGLINDTLLH
ncbi:S8 family serine peptidase [Nostoc sp. CHAB 5834]|nr:S8 family serine peptidase [Nostoc sp. CHAB 5834]